MEYKELAKLDHDIKDAHTRLISLNNQYNELLTNIYNGATKIPVPVVSEGEKKLRKKRNVLRGAYWVTFLGALLAKSFIGLPELVYSIIVVSDIVGYFFGSLYFAIAMDKEKSKKEKETPKVESDKDKLYEEVCKAREIYHSLRKQREEVYVPDDKDYQEYLEHVNTLITSSDVDTLEESQENVKTLSLEVNE